MNGACDGIRLMLLGIFFALRVLGGNSSMLLLGFVLIRRERVATM